MFHYKQKKRAAFCKYKALSLSIQSKIVNRELYFIVNENHIVSDR